MASQVQVIVTLFLGFILQAIPRSLWLDKSGKQLVQWPIAEVERLRGHQVELPSKLLEEGSVLEVTGITAAQVSFFVYK